MSNLVRLYAWFSNKNREENKNEEGNRAYVGCRISPGPLGGLRGGGGTLAAPPRKARSIDEAGNMALLYFKKGEQA